MLMLYLFSIGTAAAGARGNLSLSYHHLYDALVTLGVLCLRMSFVWILVTPGLFAVVLPSFLPPRFCGILFHLLCFLLNLISLTSKPASVLICVICVKCVLLRRATPPPCCLLYTSDAADERSSVDLGGRR